MKMPNPVFRVLILLAMTLAIFSLALGQQSAAGAPETPKDGLVRGAMLYDKWYAEIGVDAPAGDMPVWDRQTSNTRSGPDTWRCVSCHGWDYQGKDGAYRAGANFTGFPGVYSAGKTKTTDELLAQLNGTRDPAHDFSPYLSNEQLNDLINFIANGLVDDNQYIDPVSLQVLGGDSAHGKQLFDGSCASCHGEDGTALKFRFEGMDASLGTLAAVDPWRFLHKTRFGTPGTDMVIGYTLGWTAQDGRDVLLYAQSLPGGKQIAAPKPAMPQGATEQPLTGGPLKGPLGGLVTAIGTMIAGLGLNVLVAGVLIGIILLLVWALRGRQPK